MIKIEDLLKLPTPLIQWEHPLFVEKALKVWVKRDDLSHPVLSGNKFRKLKYNLKAAKEDGSTGLLSFGGAFSNHLYAMSGVSKYTDFNVKMLIRGEELNAHSSPTLTFAEENGVELIFVDRTSYRNKKALSDCHGKGCFIIPEGGSNRHSISGVAEMVDEILEEIEPDYLVASMGTGGTIAGILSNKNFKGHTIGVSSLKGGAFLKNEVDKLKTRDAPFDLWLSYSFGGYGKFNEELLKFIGETEKQSGLPLEHVYTGKMIYAVFEKIKDDYFAKGSTIVIYHSGGMQGKLPVEMA